LKKGGYEVEISDLKSVGGDGAEGFADGACVRGCALE